MAALAGLVALRAQDPVAKKPIPDASSLQQALTLVEEVYGGEVKRAKDVAQRTALAERLLQKAKESATDPTSQFALLKVAKDIAALAGDADLALRAVDDMAATFEIGTLPAKVETLLKAAQAANQTKQYPVIVGHAATLIDLAVQQDEFDAARSLSQAAIAAARKSGDSALVRKAVARGKEIDEMASAYAAVKDAIAKLKTDPVDAEANLAVGRYRCLVKGEWERGISYLALGSDPTLKELAVKELKGVSDTDEQVTLGDGWWDLAATSEETMQNQLEGRAAYWYRKASPGLTRLAKDKVEARLRAQQATGDEALAQSEERSDQARLARLIQGRFEVLLVENKSQNRNLAIWTFQQDNSVLRNGQQIATYRCSDSQVLLTFSETSLGEGSLRPKGKDVLVGVNRRAGGELWALQLRRLYVVAVWEHHAEGFGTGKLRFWSNGRFGEPDSDNTWELQGTKLTLRWPKLKAVDNCILSPDGRSYSGRSRAGVKVWGKLIPED